MNHPINLGPVTLAIAILMVVPMGQWEALAQKMYYADFGVKRANLDGRSVETIVAGLPDPFGIALDVGAGKMYWGDFCGIPADIKRANLDGSTVETIVTGLFSVRGIALDVGAGKMYWTAGPEGVQRANLDGSDVEVLVTDVIIILEGMALDITAGKMYWIKQLTGPPFIQRANLDGSSVEDVVELPGSAKAIALDAGAGKIYWTDDFTDRIQRANLDGSVVETLVTGLSSPTGIALDLSCTLDLEATYATGTLDLDFELGHTVPVFFKAGIWFRNRIVPYWSILLRPIDPPVSFSVPIEDFPPVGEVVVWTTLRARGGRICDDTVTVDTGTPEVMPSAEELQELLRRQVP